MSETSDTAAESGLAKTFDPAGIEAKWYAHWEAGGLFRPDRPDAAPFTIVNPPPNVTGSLHIGHALDNTLQDIVIRYERLRGKDALWVVGTDHAGIATQMVVERNLASQGIKRSDMSREQFLDHVWEWKGQSGGTITRQLRRLGCSMDWSREQFTMDPHFTRAVVKVFVDLYDKGLIYRDKRLVNWDPALKTAISDLEVETREVQGHFWHFRYPLADGVTLASGQDYIEVATTRPETMLADMAVAVHPDDDRYRSVIGKDILQPITGRRFKVVADEHADPELGSGAVKITPGHDFNDFEVGKRAGIVPGEMLNMLDGDARVVQTADGLIPDEFLGLDRFEARDLVVTRMKEGGFLIPHVTKDKDGNEIGQDAEPRTIQTPYGDRGGVVIEPWLTDQWYVDAATLAGPPMQAVRDGRIEIVPKSWEKTFFNWMENIQPWCVSRQLWWGHRIPAWYGPTLYSEDEKPSPHWPDIGIGVPDENEGLILSSSTDYDQVFVAMSEDEATELAIKFAASKGQQRTVRIFESRLDAFAAMFEKSLDLTTEYPIWRDPDVLDTWFSSALWPFATLGWPENTELLNKHYPNDLLISGFDILFFWDARMAMQGMEFMGPLREDPKDKVPWKKLYLHGLVRAADGQKMSKSKGNVVDPLGLIDQYGADALRFFMAAMESQGRDVKMDEKRVEGYRNFATKLWNAARFCQSNGIGASQTLAAPAATSAVNKWIIGEVVECATALDQAMADLRFDAAANTIYHFVWDQFCDWYIELVKGNFDEETKAVAGWVLDQILVMLHPFMPFITEELWSKLGERPYELIIAKWPNPGATVNDAAKAEIERLIEIIGAIRAQRNEFGIPPSALLSTSVLADEVGNLELLNHWAATLRRLARIQPASVELLDHGNFVLRTERLGNEFVITEKVDRTSFSSVQIVAGPLTFICVVDGFVEIEVVRDSLTKSKIASEKERDSLAKRLENPNFVERARPEAVEKARADHAHHAAEAERLAAALARLG